jgi:hypothetical protein
MPAVLRHPSVWLLPVCMLLAAAADAADRRAAAAIDPVGVWHCLVYGDPIYGEQRAVLWLAEDGQGYLATQAPDTVLPWSTLGDWTVSRGTLRLHDDRRRRELEAELDRSSLGGRWQSDSASGGWWCARRAGVSADTRPDLRASRTEFFLPPLVTSRMATPEYPLAAIRNAKEGRAVACFVVDANGAVLDPELVELSDEVFAEPTLRATRQSRFRAAAGTDVQRPGCRSYDYSLKVVN